jgi:predicted trehalose synthase
MNERIRKLLNEATSGLEPDISPQRTVTLNEMEKFAELIVRECAQVLETNGDNQRTIRMTESTGHNKTTDWMEGYEEAVKQYGGYLLKKNAKQIKQHFGVEE